RTVTAGLEQGRSREGSLHPVRWASSFSQKRDIDRCRYANLANRKCVVHCLGCAARILNCILKHPAARPPAPITTRRTPPTTPVVRIDAINLATLHPKF